MTSEWTNRFLSTAEFFALAKARLSLNTPEALGMQARHRMPPLKFLP
jgi:hypothetical protein